MVADDAMLMAYVDGELTPQQNDEIQRLIEASPELAHRVSLLKASCLPYQEAFAQQEMPAVPSTLLNSIEALIDSHQASSSSHRTSSSKAEKAGSVFDRFRKMSRLQPAWISLAFTAGAVSYGLVLQTGLLNHLLPNQSNASAPAVAQVSPWVWQAASYQHLYTRDTVNYVNPKDEVVTKTLTDIHQADDMALRIPDLSSAGLSFKSVQRLRFNNKALIQLVYLPEKGEPIALCVMKDLKSDQSFAAQRVAGMNVVTWRHSELSYALIGEPGGVDLNAVARLVLDGNVEHLFAESQTPIFIAVNLK